MQWLDRVLDVLAPEAGQLPPPNGGFPAVADLSRLPFKALIAYAARCARLAEPIYRDAWPESGDHWIRHVDGAINRIEKVCSATTPGAACAIAIELHSSWKGYRADVTQAVNAAAAQNADQAAVDAAEAARSAELAGSVYWEWDNGQCRNARGKALHFALHAMNYARRAADRMGQRERMDAALAADFERLHQAVVSRHWTDETPVDCVIFDGTTDRAAFGGTGVEPPANAAAGYAPAASMASR